MTENLLNKDSIICALIMIIGLFLALLFPWFADIQGLASSTETSITADNPEAVTRYYVAKTGDGTNPILGWSTAFTNVQDALTEAILTSGGEIWVAEGVYYPDEGIGQIENARESTFMLADNVKLYGGFDTNDTTFYERDWERNMTVLSGDIDQNDTNTGGVVLTITHIVGNNSYNVITANGAIGANITKNSVLDGFTITAGRANDSSNFYVQGGGFYCYGAGNGNECSPILTNINFSGNFAQATGGALYTDCSFGGKSNPQLTNVTFSSNKAIEGGAIYNTAVTNGICNPFLKNVTFFNNSANWGGALYNNGITGSIYPNLLDVTFINNSAENDGGAMYNYGKQGDSSPSLTNVIFAGNSAGGDGGAIYNYGYSGISSPSLANVVFSGNKAVFRGGAIYSDGSENGAANPILTNVTISGNFAGEIGGGMYNNGYDGNSKPLVQNSILWNNKDNSGTEPLFGNIYNNAGTVTVTHTIIQGSEGSSSWTGGSYVDDGGNVDINPLFLEPIDPNSSPTTLGNLHLQSNSPAIDAGNNSFINGISTDLDGEPRIVDGDKDATPTVDMGAYEYIEYIFDGYLPLIMR